MTAPQLPTVSTTYGAPMGRRNHPHFDDQTYIHLRRVHLDRGGYDEGGAYWGIGQPLYWASQADTGAQTFIRAYDRNHAKDQINLIYGPNLRFFK